MCKKDLELERAQLYQQLNKLNIQLAIAFGSSLRASIKKEMKKINKRLDEIREELE